MSKVLSILTVLVLSISPVSVMAANTWDAGGSDYKWSTTANWDDNTVPIDGADVTFGTAGTSATVDSARSVGLLTYNRT